MAHDDGLQHFELVEFKMVLLQDRNPLVGPQADVAVGGFDFPGQDFKERGFPRSVGADDAVTVSVLELDTHIIE